MATKKVDQKQDQNNPIIRLDADKLRFMSVDRKDVIDALASEYEDSAIEKVAATQLALRTAVERLNETRTAFDDSIEEVDKISCPERKVFVKSVLSSVMKKTSTEITNIDIDFYSKDCEQKAAYIINEQEIVNYARSILNNERINSSGSYATTFQQTGTSIAMTSDYVRVKVCKSGAKAKRKDLAKDDFVIADVSYTVLMKPTKELIALVKIRDGYAKEVLARAKEYVIAERSLKELPDVVRRLKARLTKKVMQESDVGRNILTYFSDELTASKSYQAALPAAVKKQGK